MKLIVGLGNPGEKYENTRHNIGFMTLDHLLKKYEPLKESNWENSKKTKSEIKKIEIEKTPTLLAKPQTYMNNSGMAVSLLLQYFKINSSDLIIIHDELDLPLGKIKVHFGGGSAGHNGIESILNSIGTDKFLRIRMGIGHPGRVQRSEVRGQKIKLKNDETVSNYVISNFVEGERKDVRNMIKRVQKNLELILTHGIEKYMSKYNAS